MGGSTHISTSFYSFPLISHLLLLYLLLLKKRRRKRKKSSHKIKIKLDGKKITPSRYVKYLGIVIDCHLSWKYHELELHPKLSRAIGMLCKIRHYVNFDTLRMIYFGIFSSILMYGSLILLLIKAKKFKTKM